MSKIDYSPPTQETHFIVSGGGKGITAANAIALARAYHSRFTLLGRSELIKTEPAWAHGIADESNLKQAALNHFQNTGQKTTPKELGNEVNRILSSREIQQTLDEIEAVGGKAGYIQADITTPEDLKEKLSPLIKDINGLLHGAGALADKYIEDKKEADFELVYGVKVGGLRNLLDLIPPQQLNYLILFSSVAGFYGNAGQADYSLSNEVLNKLSHHLKLNYPDCQVLSIGWGPWDGGMVTPQLKRILNRRNIPLISLEEGTQALLGLLEQPQDNPQHVIGNPLPFPDRKINPELLKHRISRRLSLESNPFLADHVIGGNAVLPTVCAVAWFINSCESLNPGYQFFAVRDYQVFKGIVFDELAPQEYILDLQEKSKTPESVILVGKISSQNPDGNDRFHYQAQVEMRKSLPERPRIQDFNLAPESPIAGESLYASKVLFHGPRFQGIQRVLNISSAGLTTECLLPSFPVEQMGQFPVRTFNPFLADVHLQSLLIWSNAQTGSIGLPLQIAGGTQYQAVAFDELTYATMIVKSSTPHKLVADVISHDQEGYIFSEVVDAEITLNQKLFELFKENQMEIEPLWI
jgi:NAD(P)-dependent dehydrogenase (short-subunit alcohol dehydrogenase family)